MQSKYYSNAIASAPLTHLVQYFTFGHCHKIRTFISIFITSMDMHRMYPCLIVFYEFLHYSSDGHKTLGSLIEYTPAKDSGILHTGAGHCHLPTGSAAVTDHRLLFSTKIPTKQKLTETY